MFERPRVAGTLLELRPLEPSDFDALFAAARDPLIWEQHPERDRHTRGKFQAYFDGALASGGALVVIDRATGRIIGSSRYAHWDPARREVEIGWTFLERAYWGGAYNRELKTLMLDHAFRFVDRVVFVVGVDNLRSQMALRKIGARFVGPFEDPERAGPGGPRVVFAIDRPAGD